MIRSMTGYGEAESRTASGRLRVEVKTVNHRYLNVNLRVPSALTRLESEIREWLRDPFTRGHVNLTVRSVPEEDAGAVGLRLDEDRVRAYLALFQQLTDRFGVRGVPDLELLARFNDIIVRGDPEEIVELPAEQVRETVLEAASHALRMREDEGLRLHADLEERLTSIEASLAAVARLAPERLRQERDRLRAALIELLDGRAVDEDRVAQEIAFLAERWDVNEELVRFRSHIELFRELLAAPAEEAVGKRLGFLVQEMHREANTIGSKANHAPLAHRVVSIKEEVERLREQVENVE